MFFCQKASTQHPREKEGEKVLRDITQTTTQSKNPKKPNLGPVKPFLRFLFYYSICFFSGVYDTI